jgi:hypothetical protein
MPENPGFTVERLALELGQALAPLATRLEGGQARALFVELGIEFPPALTSIGAIATALGNGVAAVEQLPPVIEQLTTAIRDEQPAQIVAAAASLIHLTAQVIQALDQLAAALDGVAGAVGGGIDPDEVRAFAADLGTRLLEFTVVTYLEGHHPIIASLLQLIGVVEITDVPRDRTRPHRVVYRRKRIHLDRLGDLFADPALLLRDLYGWGDAGFDGVLLLERLRGVLVALSLPVYLQPPTEPGEVTSLNLLPLALRPTAAAPLPGLELILRLALIPLPAPVRVPVAPGWSFELEPRIAGSAGVGVLVTPPAELALRPPAPGETLTGELFVRFVREPVAPSESVILFGQEGGSRLQTQRLALGGGAAVRWTGAAAEGELLVEARITGGRLVISAASMDGFLAQILPPDGFEVGFDFGVVWSSREGLRFEGSASIATTIPLHWQLGPATIDALYVALGIRGDGLALELSLNGGGRLGPISASVERLGVQGLLAFERGNLGPADLGIGFKFPTGLGVAIDAGPITGGGFISFDPANGRYEGILQLRLWTVEVTAIGLLDTRVPGAAFSFLLIITAELPPIQLGFGFTLNGIGGLVGIHRTVMTDVLLERIKHGAVDHIMFPEDPVRNAAQILGDLREIFPPAADRYVFGPMAILGWGTPTLIRAEIGLVLEVPEPIRIVLLGTLAMDLPAPEAAIVVIRIDVLGIVDFGRKFLAIDAILRDSSLVGMPLGGGMSLRVHWGDPPSFLFSVGGFHPAFQPPPGFPEIPRLSLALSFGAARLSLQMYLAVTSNSFQLGARVELFAGSSSTFIRGWAGFDVLLIFQPFSFRADISAGVELVVGGSRLASIRVAGTLTGPNPYHVWGEACLSLLFFDICVGFDETFGGGRPEPALPPRPIWPELEAALRDLGNWTAELPAATANLVSLRKPAPTAPALLAHPMGVLTVRQKVVPLDREVTRFGEHAPADATRFRVTRVRVGDDTAAVAYVTDFFAAGQFQALGDAEKLSRPSFEKMPAGVTVTSADLEHGPAVAAKLEYETKIVDSPWDSREAPRFQLPRHAMLAMAKVGAVAVSALRRSGDARYVADVPRRVAVVDDERFVIASTRDLAVRADLAAPTTKGAALEALAAHVAANPGERATLQVVALAELEEAA